VAPDVAGSIPVSHPNLLHFRRPSCALFFGTTNPSLPFAHCSLAGLTAGAMSEMAILHHLSSQG